MEILLKSTDKLFFNSFYNSTIPPILTPYFQTPSHPIRLFTSIWLLEMVGVLILYFTFASISYYFLFPKDLKLNPKYIPNQISKEIWLSVTSFPITATVTAPWLYFEVKGYSKLYYNFDDYGLPYFLFSIVWFILFTDFGVYWIHRFEHNPKLYSWLHKPHHVWKICTPYAAFAFHPLDGYFQSLPIHIFVYLFPMHIYAYLTAFVLVQIWSVSIHDGVYLANNAYINGAAHHTVHHLEFNYNYGQYFTLWDRIGGTYRKPVKEFENEMYFSRKTLKRKE